MTAVELLTCLVVVLAFVGTWIAVALVDAKETIRRLTDIKAPGPAAIDPFPPTPPPYLPRPGGPA